MDVMTENKVVPKLRFGEFQDDWETSKLNNIFTISAGGDISKENVSKVKTEAFKYPIYANAKKEKGFYAYSDIYKIDSNVVTVAGRGVHLGIAHSRRERFFPIVRLLVLKPKYECDIDYFEHRINLIRLFIESTGVPQLTAPQISNYSVSFPSLPEQQKLASFLGAVEMEIQQLTKKKELLEDYKKGVMQKIFSQDIRFKDDGGNNYPDWEEKKLGDISKVYQPKTISQTDLTEEGYYVYGANGIIGKYHSYNHEFRQIAVTCRGNTCGTVNFTKPYSWITGNAMVVNLDNSDDCNKKFVYFQLYNSNFRYLITGSGQPQITGDIKFHKLKLPLLKEQKKIADFLSSIDKKTELVNIQIENTKAFKKGLLQQMFV